MPNLRKGENVVESSGIEGGGVTIPTTYRIEVRAERETNPQEKANISVCTPTDVGTFSQT